MHHKLALTTVFSSLLALAVPQGAYVVAQEMSPSGVKLESIMTPVNTQDEAPTALPTNVQADLAPQKNDELVVDRYPGGAVKIERQVTLNENDDFVNNGLYRAFDPQGKSMGTGNFRMGKRYGQWERVFPRVEGNVLSENAGKGFAPPFRSIAAFNDGQLDGEWTITDSKDRVLIQWHFVNGRREGIWIWFNPDGSIRQQVTYASGRVAGDIVASDGKEKFKVIHPYLDGRELVPAVAWHARGKKKYEGHILKPREITEVKVDWWNGIVRTKVVRTEEQEDRHGQWRFWYSNGKLSKQGTYDRGKRVGMFTWWHPNGQKKAEGIYAADRPRGLWQTWHASAARQSYGEYVDGQRDGRWLTWHSNGMRQFEGYYAAGALTAPARSWDIHGKLVRLTQQKPDSAPLKTATDAQRNSLSKLPTLDLR